MTRTNKDSCRRGLSKRSTYGLDILNLLMADVRDGVSPFLSVYLKGSQHWGASNIGIAMAVSSMFGAVCQIPAGLLVDGIRRKRALVALSGLAVAAGCVSIALFPGISLVIVAQALLGAASAIIPPAVAAISLGLVGPNQFPARVSRNEGFNHAGNFAAALLAGFIGQRYGYQWIFFLVCFCAVGSVCAVVLIRPSEIDHAIARGGQSKPEDRTSPERSEQLEAKPIALVDLFRRKDLVIFLVSVILFHFGNAAMLPMAGQVLAKVQPGADVSALGASIRLPYRLHYFGDDRHHRAPILCYLNAGDGTERWAGGRSPGNNRHRNCSHQRVKSIRKESVVPVYLGT